MALIHQDILELVGNTPMVEVKSFNVSPSRLLLKLESQNPGGSIKDRIGISMIEGAERDGKIKPGDTLIEATAGNTGLGLALVALRKGYKLLLVVPDKMSQEKIFHLKAMGVEIVMTRSDVEKGHPEYYQDYALRLSKEIPNSFYINQFDNPHNPRAHETTTGPEIMEQTGGAVDAVVVGVGSAGTIGGLTRYFLKVKPSVEIVLADPEGSILKDYSLTGQYTSAGSWAVEGIGEDFVPKQFDKTLVKHAYSISDKEAFELARTLLRQEGIFAGSSTGVLLGAALRYAKEVKEPKTIVTFACDTGSKYLSKMYNDYWLIDNGYLERPRYGDLRDVIARSALDRSVVTVGPDDTLNQALYRMRIYSISQLPVVRDTKVVGLLDEYDVMVALEKEGAEAFQHPVSRFMSTNLITLQPQASFHELAEILKQGYTAIIVDQERFYGLITKIDYINYLRLKEVHR